ncbi:MAG: SOS response-associated peptidase [Planctomycetota bacterium]|nr:SOS response-associated peptidase [Planctomycetota bacterium]
MCGRFGFNVNRQRLAECFGLDLDAVPDLTPRYNIAPTQPVAVVRQVGEKRAVAMMRWGLTAAWSGSRPLFNARAETIHSKSAFREAFAQRRCLVPASWFYEWPRDARGEMGKRAFMLARRDHAPFAFAGVWDASDKGDAVAVVTCAPNALMVPIHDRMPVILQPDAFGLWLAPDAEPARGLLAPRPWDDFEAVPVGSYVNSTRNEGPDCILPAAPEPTQGELF